MSLRTLINGWLEGDGASPAVPAQSPRSADRDLETALSHEYFTDGANLYRFLGWTGRSVSTGLAELEDCRSLDILLVTAEMFIRGPLRPIELPC